jgi:hypothetical protein
VRYSWCRVPLARLGMLSYPTLVYVPDPPREIQIRYCIPQTTRIPPVSSIYQEVSSMKSQKKYGCTPKNQRTVKLKCHTTVRSPSQRKMQWYTIQNESTIQAEWKTRKLISGRGPNTKHKLHRLECSWRVELRYPVPKKKDGKRE